MRLGQIAVLYAQRVCAQRAFGLDGLDPVCAVRIRILHGGPQRDGSLSFTGYLVSREPPPIIILIVLIELKMMPI